MATSLLVEGLSPLHWAALSLCLLPWLLLLKMRWDFKDVLNIGTTEWDLTNQRSPVFGSAVMPGKALMALLKENRLRGRTDPCGHSIAWELEIVIPAYNEELNIEACVNSFAESALALHREHALRTQIIVVDDQSTDQTFDIVAACRDRLETQLRQHQAPSQATTGNTPVSIAVIKTPERPEAELWLGKNWACHTGFSRSQADHLFFVDADVSTKEAFLKQFLERVSNEIQFAGFVPTIVCKSFVDYIVQPHVALSSLIQNNLSSSLKPASKRPHAFGQCIYITRNAYLLTGGYEAANNDSKETRGLETRALAKNIVRMEIPALNIAGSGLIDVYMYRDAKSLWEGWTKNFFMAVDQSLLKAFTSIAMLLLLFDVPVLFLAWPPARLFVPIHIIGHFGLRLFASKAYKVPLKGWFLFPLGGLALSIIMIGSAYKVKSQKNWTWKGRSLALKPQ